MLSAGRKGLPPETIAETVKTALFAPRPRTRYSVTPGPIQDAMATLLPKRLVDRIIARQLGLTG